MNPNATFEIRFQLRTKTRSAADTETVSSRRTGRIPRITQVLALAIYFEEMIRCGEAKDYAHVARLSCSSRERVSQIVRLNYLAPDIQIELLYLPPTPIGHYPVSETAVRKVANILAWPDQRREWTALKQRHQLGA